MRMRLEASDEYMHTPDADNYNESMYFNAYDPDAGVGGFFRVGNRPNEGYAEVTTCLWLPQGRCGFMFSRPAIDDNDAFDAAGMRFEVLEPFEELTVSYEGPVAVLDDPTAMADPKKAFGEAPHMDAAVELAFRGVSPMWGGEPEEPFEGMEFARGHYEQHVGAVGEITVGPDSWKIDGYGLRDHSWGPRYWQAPLWYRWLTCNAGADDGFMVSIVASRDGDVRRRGVLLRGDDYVPITDAKIETTWTDPDRYQSEIRCVAQTPDGDLEITGEVSTFIPLRNRREGQVTRIGEGLTTYRWDGKVGYGLSEYLDQIEDGSPVGA